jgi:hypothetical protein
LQLKLAEKQFSEALRLATSIQHGTVTASLILRKLSAYPRQNGLALALRELGRIERTIFTLKWLQEPALRRRVSAGLNKGEARNALARAIFFHRLGEIRDRSFENQYNRASGLNLVTAAIVLWNTVYLELSRTRDRRSEPAPAVRRCPDRVRRPAWLESHQPHGRLSLAGRQTGRQGPIPAAAPAATLSASGLAYKISVS